MSGAFKAESPKELSILIKQRLGNLLSQPLRTSKQDIEQWTLFNVLRLCSEEVVSEFPVNTIHNGEEVDSEPDFYFCYANNRVGCEVTSAVPSALAHARAVAREKDFVIFYPGHFRVTRDTSQDVRKLIESGDPRSPIFVDGDDEREAVTLLIERAREKAFKVPAYLSKGCSSVMLILYENGPGSVDLDKLHDLLTRSLDFNQIRAFFSKVVILGVEGSQVLVFN